MSQQSNNAGSRPPLPYWDEYLATILRPRVEKIAQGLASKVEKTAMDALARRIAEEQPEFPGGADAIEQILRDSLGLRFRVSLQPVFGDGEGGSADDGEGFPAATVNHDEDDDLDEAVGEVIEGHDSVVERRPFDNPLARAVGIRKDRGR
ncbi:MAG: hypothetical protein ACTS27_05295 [Phycisphaerales bacterium]